VKAQQLDLFCGPRDLAVTPAVGAGLSNLTRADILNALVTQRNVTRAGRRKQPLVQLPCAPSPSTDLIST